VPSSVLQQWRIVAAQAAAHCFHRETRSHGYGNSKPVKSTNQCHILNVALWLATLLYEEGLQHMGATQDVEVEFASGDGKQHHHACNPQLEATPAVGGVGWRWCTSAALH
jgi:hypothetical protein